MLGTNRMAVKNGPAVLDRDCRMAGRPTPGREIGLHADRY